MASMNRTTLRGLLLAAILATPALATPAFADTPDGVRAGTAGGVHGQVQIAKADYTPAQRQIGQQIGSGEPIYMGDQISTGAGGGLQVMLMDQTVMTLGQNAKITIDDMVYDPKSGNGKLNFSVAQGAFRYVSGQIAKNNPENVAIKTPMATIGIRGTIVGGDVGPQGTLVALLGPGGDTDTSARHGAIVVNTPQGSVEISRTGYVTEIHAGQPPSPPAPATPDQLQHFGQAGAGQNGTASNNAPNPGGTASSSSSGGTAASGGGSVANSISGSNLVSGGAISNIVNTVLTQQRTNDQTQNMVSGTQQKAKEDGSATSTATTTTVEPLASLTNTSLTLTDGVNLSQIIWNGDAGGINDNPAKPDTVVTVTSDHNWSIADSSYGTVTFSDWTTGSVEALPTKTRSSTVSLDMYRSYILHDLGSYSGLIYSTYGLWEAGYTTFNCGGPCGDTVLGAYAFGIETPLASMPSGGTATYTGSAAGWGQTGQTSFSYLGTITLNADFGNKTIGGTITPTNILGVTNVLSSTPFASVTLNSASFSGSNSYASGITINGGDLDGMTGTYAGKFYGPGAQETAGTLNAASSGNYLNGSFGAKR